MPMRESAVPEAITGLASPVRQFVHGNSFMLIRPLSILALRGQRTQRVFRDRPLEMCDVTPRASMHGERQTTGRRIRPRPGFAGGRPFLAILTMRFASLSESWRTALASARRLAGIT